MKPSSAVRRAASSGPAAAVARRARAEARARVAARSSRTRRVALARASRSFWCSARRSRATCSPGARERCARWRARSITARRACTASRPARAATAARASPQCSGTAVSAAWVGVEQLTAATSSISVRSVWWPTEAMTGTRSSATVRHSVSSQKAKRSAIDPPPRATTTTSTSSTAARSCRARVMAGAAWRSWTGAKAHTTRPAQPRRRSPASTSSRALPLSPVTTPMQRGSAGRARRFWGSNSPSAASVRRRTSTWASRSPSPASRRPLTANENDGEAVRDPA